MMIVADTHVHVYPFHEAAVALEHGYLHLTQLAQQNSGIQPDGVARLCCLSESEGCGFFRGLQADPESVNGWTAESLSESCTLKLKSLSGHELYITAGRQIVTKERLEVLALGTDHDFESGLPVHAALKAVREIGALPVLAWAPGKWFFERGRIVRDLIDTEEPGSFVAGDSSLRPRGWPEPCLMHHARERGFPVVAGSDPLPLAGEEKRLGTYAVAGDDSFEEDRPFLSLRKALANGSLQRTGKRPSPSVVGLRLFRNARRRKKAVS